MERLDDVCGPENWRNEFQQIPGAFLCGLSVRIGDEWVTKWDGAQESNIEATKGGISGAMKRAAVQWGIGRYLYNLDEFWANVHDKGSHYAGQDQKKGLPAMKWDPPSLPSWAVPAGTPTQPKANPHHGDTTATALSPDHDRVKAALHTLFGADKKAALDQVEKMTAFQGKDGPVAGVRDFTKLTGKRLEILADKLEKLAADKRASPDVSLCSQCRSPLSLDGKCLNEECPNCDPF
jgi:hypothetical protein